MLPIVGITCDLDGESRVAVRRSYAEAVARAGGMSVLLPPVASLAHAHAAMCDALVLTGGDDPAMEPFGKATDPRVTLVHPDRQAYETALLTVLARTHPDKPVLGVCLGMQMMALVAGGDLDQFLPEPDVARHWDREHPVLPEAGAPVHLAGIVRSRHKQAVRDPGTLAVIARAGDDLIEAVADPSRRFYVGVQWHPERTADAGVGDALFERLVRAAR